MKIFKEIVWNLLFFAIVVLGTFCDLSGFANLAVFLAWIVFLSSLCLLLPDFVKQMSETKWPHTPTWFHSTIDLTIVFIMAYHGWFFTAILTFASLILFLASTEQVKKERIKND